ncbi:hypothetical protein MBANPS3_010047 [Mucor bainieri]
MTTRRKYYCNDHGERRSLFFRCEKAQSRVVLGLKVISVIQIGCLPNTLVMDSIKKRPDAAVYKMDQDPYHYPVAFGEAKLKSANNILLVKDLLRIAMFSKDSIDSTGLSTVASFQAVGNRVSFYAMQLKNDGLLYIMLELCSLELPTSLDDLLMFTSNADDLLALIQTVALCKQSPNNSAKPHRRPSYDSPQYKNFLLKKNQAVAPTPFTLKF